MANVQPVMEGRVYGIFGKDNCADRLMKHIREKLTFWVPKVLHKQKGKKQTLHLLFFSVSCHLSSMISSACLFLSHRVHPRKCALCTLSMHKMQFSAVNLLGSPTSSLLSHHGCKMQTFHAVLFCHGLHCFSLHFHPLSCQSSSI